MNEHIAITPLRWFPKQFRAGDMDGTGGDRLLGRTELSALEVLIRETAQNSWDARLHQTTPRFGIHLRRVDFRLRADLNRLFDTSRAPGRHHSPEASNIHVLEIYDRGTSGLDGPTDLSPVTPGKPCNFQDLILKVGVPRDDGKGGGTYGFGKTAAYAFSEQGTVIFWTRCRTGSGALEHRFVVSAVHDSYVSGGKQYTGRHWWGEGEDDLVSPIVGQRAREYGERFFARHFKEDETGTSLLILDPQVPVPTKWDSDEPDTELRQYGDRSALEAAFVKEARQAVRQHLWPKLIAAPGSSTPPMPIDLLVDDRQVDVADATTGAIASWGAGLNAIRAHILNPESKTFAPSGLPVEVHEVTRRGHVIGHLAVVRRLRALEGSAPEDDLDPVSEEGTIQRIALMRGLAELVVTTDDWSDHTASPVFDWLAVFKSTEDWDHVFADAEPPAHDMWISNAGGETGLVVRAMRNRVRSLLRDIFAVPEPVTVAPLDPSRSGVSGVARMFGMLLPTTSGPVQGDASARTRPRSGGRRERRLPMSVAGPKLLETLPDGRQRQQVDFVVNGRGIHAIDISVSIVGDDGARSEVPSSELELAWSSGTALSANMVQVQGDAPHSVTLLGPPRRALRIEMNASPVDARD
ncbi:hypothetical protein [Microbacterium sp.]|uniref:hypothetical protein n=1 Tax=Microbacterium sp. TaxID=51671 RepID=UPI0028B1FE84|nr:hypothetical protein [Microbacterium sp.]